MSYRRLSLSDLTGSLTAPDGATLQLAPLREGDIDAVSLIERSAHSHPWSPSLFSDCLRGRQMCVLAREEGILVAYIVITAEGGDSELLNITVAPPAQGRGLGTALLQHLSRALQGCADTLYLEVRVSNTAAIALYHSAGFVEVGTRPRYYPAASGREDAVIFALTL